MDKQRIDHLLRSIWTAQEKGDTHLESIQQEYNSDDLEAVLAVLQEEGLIKKSGDVITLTPAGYHRAEEIIRRYRLAERLFADLFDVSPTDYEYLACNFEHILSPEVTDSVCTFLGHPRVCPHNNPIPRGKCCINYINDVEPLVQPLVNVPVGSEVKIVYMLPGHQKRWRKLHQLGVFPGNTLRLVQRKPSYVLEIGGTTIALDREICEGIFVKRLNQT